MDQNRYDSTDGEASRGESVTFSDRLLGNLGYTLSDQTVGNILKRHGIPPAPQRQTTMPWREFIRIHMDLLLTTDFPNSARSIYRCDTRSQG